MSYSIRPFHPSPTAYEALVALYGQIWPDERHFSAAMWQENDEEWPESALNRRFILEREGRLVGMAACYEKYWQHRPGTVHLEWHLTPGHRQANRLLYDFLLDFLSRKTSPPQILATEAREDRPGRIAFLEGAGFAATMRTPRAALRVADFDPAPYSRLEAALAARGITIHTLAAIRGRDAEWKRKLYDLRWAIVQDVPAVEPPTRPTMAEFEQMVLADPALAPEAWFIAVDQGAQTGSGSFVGMSNLWLNDPGKQRLDTGLTGVRRPYRRQGIATALKVQTIRYAHRLGALTIETDNEENNPVYALNLALGFRPRAAWISYRKQLAPA